MAQKRIRWRNCELGAGWAIMSAKKQGSRRPSRKNVVITPHKGGRTERFEARLTPAEKQAIMKVIQESGLSSADWLVQVSGTANTACS